MLLLWSLLNRKTATMDHILPISRGGKTTKGNIALCCKDCNSKKKYYTPVEWQFFLKTIKTQVTHSLAQRIHFVLDCPYHLNPPYIIITKQKNLYYALRVDLYLFLLLI